MQCMSAFIHLLCMHRARRIFLTTSVFQIPNWIHVNCAFSHVIHRLAEPTLVTLCMRCIRHLTWTWIMHWLLTCSCFRYGGRCKYLCFSISHACECYHDSMFAMWRIAYVILLFECPWVKVGLVELEKLVEIRVLAYMRVAKSKTFFQEQTDMQFLFTKLGNIVYTYLIRA